MNYYIHLHNSADNRQLALLSCKDEKMFYETLRFAIECNGNIAELILEDKPINKERIEHSLPVSAKLLLKGSKKGFFLPRGAARAIEKHLNNLYISPNEIDPRSYLVYTRYVKLDEERLNLIQDRLGWHTNDLNDLVGKLVNLRNQVAKPIVSCTQTENGLRFKVFGKQKQAKRLADTIKRYLDDIC